MCLVMILDYAYQHLTEDPEFLALDLQERGPQTKKIVTSYLPKCQELTEGQRTAYFTCAMVFASPTAIIRSVVATCDGVIALDISGRHGFGYDPLFLKSGYHRTFAELDEMTKNRISHRRKAFDKLALTIHSIMERAMYYLIDGYNVFFKTQSDKAFIQEREAFLDFMCSSYGAIKFIRRPDFGLCTRSSNELSNTPLFKTFRMHFMPHPV